MAKNETEARTKQVGWRISEDLRRRVNIQALKENKAAEVLVSEWLEQKLEQVESEEDQRETRG